MSYGALFKNGSDFVLIDDAYQNHEIKASGSQYIASDGGTPIIDYPSYGAGAILFIRNTTDYYYVGMGGGVALVNSAGSLFSGTVDWAVAALASSTPSGGYGLNVRNAAGALVFASQRSYMRLVQSSKVTFDSSGNGSIVVAVSAPMVDAMPTRVSYWMEQSGGYGEPSGFTCAGFRTSGSTLYTKLFLWGFNPGVYSPPANAIPSGVSPRWNFAR